MIVLRHRRAIEDGSPRDRDGDQVQPGAAAGLEELARLGQAALAGDAVAHPEDQLAYPEIFMARMRSFLRDLALRPPA